MLPEVLTIEEAAKWLKVPVQLLEKEIDTGRINAFKIGHLYRIPVTSLRGLIETPPSTKVESPSLESLQLTPVADFEYRWPAGDIESYINAKGGELIVGTEHFSVRIGECLRDSYGRARKRLVVFINKYPCTEFVETDKPLGHYYALFPGNPEPKRHLHPGDPIDPEWRQYTIMQLNEVVTSPRAGDSLVAVVPENNPEAMIRFAWLKGDKKWGW